MRHEQRLFSAVLAALLVSSMAAQEQLKEATHRPPVAVSTNSTTTTTNTTTNSTSSHSGVLLRGMNVDSMMMQRALYVLIGFTMLGVLYLLVRAVRNTKRPQQKKKKYGLLENYDDGVELDPMDSDEDDTLYEARALRR